MATGTNAWSLPVLINNLEARVNALGGGGGGVTNPLTSNLAAAGFNVTGVGQLTASRLGVSLGAVDTATVADTIGNTWLAVDVGGNIQLGTAGGVGKCHGTDSCKVGREYDRLIWHGITPSAKQEFAGISPIRIM